MKIGRNASVFFIVIIHCSIVSRLSMSCGSATVVVPAAGAAGGGHQSFMTFATKNVVRSQCEWVQFLKVTGTIASVCCCAAIAFADCERDSFQSCPDCVCSSAP